MWYLQQSMTRLEFVFSQNPHALFIRKTLFIRQTIPHL